MEKVNNLSGRSEKLKARWECTNFSFERDRSFGYSWPQRNYNCNFCKKEFKSAQALGGHMNVHRRDRAKQLTQQYSPSSSSSDHINYAPLPSNPNPNSNPKLLSPPPPPPPVAATRFLPYITYAAASSAQDDISSIDGVAVSPQIREIRKKLAMEANFRHEFKGLNQKQEMSNNEVRVWKKKNDHDQFLGLDLNMTSTHEIRDGKEDLDLELRLGRF